VQIGQAEMIMRCPADLPTRVGDALTAHVLPDHLHLFDAASGLAL
jgi:hypothetical protein